jgi:hypothetical protein
MNNLLLRMTTFYAAAGVRARRGGLFLREMNGNRRSAKTARYHE